MSSVLVVVVLVGLWALVLVPAFRDRQARIDSLRSVDRFSATLRVLSRRGAHGTPDRRWVVMPPRPVAPVVAARRAPVLSAAARRRRTVSGLAGIAVLTLLLVAVAGNVWLLAQLPTDVALGCVLVWCARSTARERERRIRAARRERRAAVERAALAAAESAALAPAWSPVARPAAAPVRRAVPVMTVPLGGVPPEVVRPDVRPVVPAQVERVPSRRAAAADVRAAALAGPVAARAAAARVAVTGRVVTAEAVLRDEPFIPEPSSGVRLLDLTTPGAWTRRRVLDDEPAAPEVTRAEADLADDSGLDILLARRTAASGW